MTMLANRTEYARSATAGPSQAADAAHRPGILKASLLACMAVTMTLGGMWLSRPVDPDRARAPSSAVTAQR